MVLSLIFCLLDWVSILDQFEDVKQQPSYIKKRLELALKSPETMPQLWLLEKMMTTLKPIHLTKQIKYSDMLGEVKLAEQRESSTLSETKEIQFSAENFDTFMSMDKIEQILHCDLEKKVLYYMHNPLKYPVKKENKIDVSPVCFCGLLFGCEIDCLDVLKRIEETLCELSNRDISLIITVKENFQISGSASALKDIFKIQNIVNVVEGSHSDIGFLYSSTEEAFGRLAIIILNLDHLTVAVNSGLGKVPQSIWSLNLKTRYAVLEALHNKTEYTPHSLHPPYYTHDFSFWIEDDNGKIVF